MDILVDVGVLENDDWAHVPEVKVAFAGVDRQNPRAEIFMSGG